MRNKPKWYSILLVGIVLLLASLLSSCQASSPPPGTSSPPDTSPPLDTSSFDTYTNYMWGYAISYPDDWDVDSAKPEHTMITPPSPYIGLVSISVRERSSLPIRDKVQIWLEVEAEYCDSFTVLDSREMEGMWDWYVSCDCYWEEYDMELHEEMYYKDTAQYSYVVEIGFEKADYGLYPLSEIADTFTLLQEQEKEKEVLSASFVITDWEQDYYEYNDEWSDYVYVYYEVENTGDVDIDYYEVFFIVECKGNKEYYDWTNGSNVRVGKRLSDSTLINVAGKEVMDVEVEDWELTAYGYG